MAQEAISIFGIEPDADLAIMRPNQTLDDTCRSVFEKLPAVLEGLLPYHTRDKMHRVRGGGPRKASVGKESAVPNTA